jgi:acyl-CoA dehydrogenase
VRAELSARVTLPAQVQGLAVARPEGGLRPVAAVLLAADIAGTAARLLAMTVAYANERVQFGKPIGRQQAIQQQLAVMAEDAVASRMGAELACAGGLPVRVEVAATAKSVASAAAARMANTAHAVHGAIGISEEFDLQLFTRRLQAARRAAGSESYWNGLLGAARLADAEGTVDWVRRRIFA